MKIKVGDLVRVSSVGEDDELGSIVQVEEKTGLFSEKYAILETSTYVHVLCGGEIKVFDWEDYEFEVIDEAG
tara:strand:- start:595 stop:810 length:216 start_codon:yes stop_codon:yes gene_type:complete